MTSKTTDTTATELRQAIAMAKGGRRNARVPIDLRKRALEVLEAGRACGTKARETAAVLGVHETTLLNWQRDLARAPFVQAQIAEHRPPEREVASPAPTRALRVMVIDGLDMATLGVLLRGLS